MSISIVDSFQIDCLVIRALHLAASMASVEPLKFLLSIGFDPNVINSFRETPLFIATRTNNIDAAAVLIESGADCRCKDAQGRIDSISNNDEYRFSFVLGRAAFDYILDIDEWLATNKFDEDTHARLRAYKYKDIRTLMYTVSSKLNQFDARQAANRNVYLQKSYQKLNQELTTTENEFYESPRLRRY